MYSFEALSTDWRYSFPPNNRLVLLVAVLLELDVLCSGAVAMSKAIASFQSSDAEQPCREAGQELRRQGWLCPARRGPGRAQPPKVNTKVQ